jgi:hypothetical protein
MADIAQLGFAVDTTGLAKGEVALKKLAGASAVAERAATGVTVANDNVSAASDRAAASYMRLGNAAKMASFQQRNLVFQLNDVFVSLASGMNPLMVAAQQGSQIATIYGPGEGGIGRAFKETGKLITGVLTRFPLVTAAVAGISAAFGALTYEVNKTTKVNVGFGDVALAVFQTISDALWNLVKPAVDALAPWFAAAYELVKTHTVDGVNFIVGAFTGGFGVIRDLWKQLPAIIGDLTAQAAQASLDAFNSAIQYLTGSGAAPEAGRYKIPNANAGAASRAFSDASGIMGDAMSQDYLGGFFSSIRNNAIRNALAGDKNGKETKDPFDEFGLKDATLDFGKDVEDILSSLEKRNQQLRNSFTSLGSTIVGAFRNGASAADAFSSVLDSVASMLLQTGLNSLASVIFPGAGATGFGADPWAGLRSIPGRATGGPVSKNRPYMVGERGPELFVPGASGGIVANQNLGGANVQVINNYAGNASVSTEGSGSAGDPLRIVIDAVKNDMAKNGIGAGAEGRYGLRRQTRAR